MSLLITITKHPDDVQLAELTKTFSEQGGIIGRGADSNWVLPDPERFLSGCHSQINCENGNYFLTDVSTNGTFINGALEPLGKGNKVQLKDGDRFSLGDYELQVTLWGAEQSVSDNFASESSGPFSTSDAPFDNSPDVFDSPFGGSAGNLPVDEPLFSAEPEETDPLAALDNMHKKEDPGAFQTDVFGGSYADQSGAVNQSVNWPESVPESGGIPDNWDDDMSAAQGVDAPQELISNAPGHAQLNEVENKQQMLESSNAKMQAELNMLKQHIASQQTPVQNKAESVVELPVASKQAIKISAADNSLIEMLGFSNKNLTDKQIQNISHVVGQIMRETVSGMMKVLSSRSSIKNEFRMNVTTIQPVENNPLKFSANVDDALENMFIKEGNSYKKPVEAVREGFEGIAEHQVAIIAGIRSAFSGVMKRFDPVVLQERFSKHNKPSLIPAVQKAKNWDAYCNYYKNLVDDMDNSFQFLYGDEFVQAYEDHLQKLVIERKSQNKSKDN